ncbi:FAD binding domain-containing protein [Durotheca rogersii]|uniref:FAD binding domain-containing protein n=1 Tax=Durotheca rogersii TaxID=419775 RepID=UPI00221E4DD6|nr:FAD binding domain-containing protein [Durotheca rogersii]KAI5859278.1 FAD binding domain-containing protein [Durotheca rogersii]
MKVKKTDQTPSGDAVLSGLHICIVGGGVVGLVGGIFLRQYGFRVTILERDTTLKTIGAGIQLHPNAVRVLQDLGIYEKIRSKSVVPPSIILKEYTTGEILHNQDLLEPARKYGAPVLTLHRGDLRGLLYDGAVAEGVDVRHGVSIDLGDIDLVNGVVKLSGQSEVLRADLIIGADGAHSVVREALAGRKDEAVPHGKVVNRILIEEKAIAAVPSLRYLVEKPNIIVWLGPECQAVTYVLDGTFNIAFTWPSSLDPNDMFFGPQPVDLDEFRSRLDNWEPELRDLVGLAEHSLRWMLFEPIVDDKETPWVDTRGKFCIVGDAAHRVLPYLAQGAAIGIESIALLAHLLAKVEDRGQIKDCLDIYQRLRKERTSQISRATLKNGRNWQMADGPLKEERNRVFLTEVPTAGFPNLLADPFFQEWLWGYDASKAADEAWSRYKPVREGKELKGKG